MSELGWFCLIAFAAIALASVHLKGITKLRGPELAAAAAIASTAAITGSVIAASISADNLGWSVTGSAAGIAAVAAGPTMLRYLGKALGALTGRLGGGGA